MYSLRTLYELSKQARQSGSDHRMLPISSTTGLGMWFQSVAQVRSIDTLGAVHKRSIRPKLGDPPYTIRSPRRLFPQRRTSLCRYLPPKTLQTTDFDAENYEQDCSDDGSSSSSGTVKMGALSKLDLPDPNSWLPLADCYPVEQPCTPYLLHHIDEKMEGVPYQLCPSTPATVSSGLDDAFTSPSYYTNKAAQRKVRIDSKPKVCGSGPNLGLKTTQSLPNLREASHRSELESADPTHLEGVICQINEWDASVQLYTVAALSPKGRIEIHHHARISVRIPKQEIETERICLNLVVTHGLHGTHTRHLEAGHSSLYFDDEPFSLPSSKPANAEIEIIRNVCDIERPLDLYFASSYPTSEDHTDMQVLPSFRPSNGRVLSESVFLGEPVAPLVMKTKARSLYSTWKATPHPLSKVTQFERIDTPPLYPLGLRDDLRIAIMELSAVKFQSLGMLAATDVVWNFDIKIQQLPGTELECRMSLYLEVGMASNRLMTIDSHGWIPKFFLVDGSLATEQIAEWRHLGAQLTLFKQAHMLPGPMKLELNWQEPPDMTRSNGNKPYELLLPRVLDREVLGGSLTCKNIRAAFLANSGTKDHFELESDAYLPTMHKGYRLYLNRKPKVPNLPGHQPTLSPISEGLEANNDTGSDQSFVTSPENRMAESNPETSFGPSPDLEANNDPPGGESPHEAGTESPQTGGLGWLRTVLFVIIMAAVLGNIWMVHTSWLPELGDFGTIDIMPASYHSHKVKNLTYVPAEDSRFSHEVEELGPRGDENLGLDTLTDSMIAGTESYEEEEDGGWRWWRDTFDHTFGWPGPIYE